MTELEAFAKHTLDNNGAWFELERSDTATLFKTWGTYMVNWNYYNDTPVYQVFDKKGKRIFASTNFDNAYKRFQEA